MSQHQSEQKTEGRVWFITGTSSGFGRALVSAVTAHGDSVVATARDVSDITDLKAVAPERVAALYLDVTDAKSIRDAVAETYRVFGRIDVVVNNAGYGLVGAFEELTEGALRRQFETNLFGAMAVTRATLPALRRQRSGLIVQISSVNGTVSGPGVSAYAGTKFALEAMSEALASEVAHLGVRVMIVEPGSFRTAFLSRSLRVAQAAPDYNELLAPARRELAALRGAEPGDPHLAARSIIAAAEMDPPPLRLPLGADAFSDIRAYLTARLAQLDEVETNGHDTAFPVDDRSV